MFVTIVKNSNKQKHELIVQARHTTNKVPRSRFNKKKMDYSDDRSGQSSLNYNSEAQSNEIVGQDDSDPFSQFNYWNRTQLDVFNLNGSMSNEIESDEISPSNALQLENQSSSSHFYYKKKFDDESNLVNPSLVAVESESKPQSNFSSFTTPKAVATTSSTNLITTTRFLHPPITPLSVNTAANLADSNLNTPNQVCL